MREFTRQCLRRDGSALMATLAVVAALALMVVLVSRVLRDDQKYVMARQARMEALAWAEAGIAIASHPVIKRGDPALMWTGPAGEGYQVTLQAEDARLNPSKVLGRGDDQLIEALFTLWGMDMDTISALVGAMRDWGDADDLESLNGAEEGAYEERGLPGLPPNRPFASVQEIRHVKGAQVLDQVRPGWENLFTTRGSGTIDLKDAPAELVAAACGVPMEKAIRFLELRAGPDGIPDNEDDPELATVADALALLGPPGVPMEVLTPRVTVNSKLQRITSTGRAGRISRTIAAIVSKGSSRPVMLWRGEVAADRVAAGGADGASN